MEEFLLNLLGGTQGLFAYLAVFGVLLACGLGVPLPEDISLILGGYLAHHGAASLPIMMFVGFAGIIVGDSLIFYAGRRVGSKVGDGKHGFLARVVTPEKRAKVERLFARHGEKIVMIARFLPGVRAVTYFTAGSVGMKYWRFIFFDGVAALASAPAFVYLGYAFGGELDLLISKLKDGQIVVFGALLAAVVGYFLYRRRRNARLRAAATAPPAGTVAPLTTGNPGPSASPGMSVGVGSSGDGKPLARDVSEPLKISGGRSGMSLNG